MLILDMTTAYNNFLHMPLFLLQIPTATAACNYKIFTLYSHTSGIWDYLLGIVNKNMAYILKQSSWLSLCDMISVGSHKDCQVLLNAKKKEKEKKSAAMIAWRDDVTPSSLVNCESCHDLEFSQTVLTCIRTAQISPIFSALIVLHHNKHLNRVSIYTAVWCKTSGKQYI